MLIYHIAGLTLCATLVLASPRPLKKDTFPTSAGSLEITFIGHASLFVAWHGKIIHIDPYKQLADYTKLPPADLVLITHQHADHLDTNALRKIRTPQTVVVLAPQCAASVANGTVMKNGDTLTVAGVRIEAVPAYNLVHKRDNGQPFHPRGEGNGYVLTCGDQRLYIAGDTEDIPEMKSLKNIDIAFLPVNLPYTMTPEMAAAAARMFRPHVLYPYHYGDTDIARLAVLLKDTPAVEVRVREMK
jgi:L-ascorbate metabolism protein UlaG (beta-lactamase superfamily)